MTEPKEAHFFAKAAIFLAEPFKKCAFILLIFLLESWKDVGHFVLDGFKDA